MRVPVLIDITASRLTCSTCKSAAAVRASITREHTTTIRQPLFPLIRRDKNPINTPKCLIGGIGNRTGVQDWGNRLNPLGGDPPSPILTL